MYKLKIGFVEPELMAASQELLHHVYQQCCCTEATHLELQCGVSQLPLVLSVIPAGTLSDTSSLTVLSVYLDQEHITL